MDTQTRLREADAFIRRAKELMAELEREERMTATVTRLALTADTYINLANVLLESVKVRMM